MKKVISAGDVVGNAVPQGQSSGIVLGRGILNGQTIPAHDVVVNHAEKEWPALQIIGQWCSIQGHLSLLWAMAVFAGHIMGNSRSKRR